MDQFEKVYKQYFLPVYKYLVRLTGNASLAEELTDETFFKALNSIDAFKGECPIYVWLCQIAKNNYISYCRKQKHTTEMPEDDQLPSDDSIQERIVDKDSAMRIHALLHKMEEPYKEVFTLRLFGELAFGDIGHILGKSEGWARVTYHRARLKLMEQIKED